MTPRGRQTSQHQRSEFTPSSLFVNQTFVPLRDAFTPTRPQRSATGFVGRETELRRMVEVIEDEQAHVVLFADRGLGKTSIINRMIGLLRAAGYGVGRYFCDSNSDYETIMRGLVRDLPSSFLVVPVSSMPNAQGSEQALPQRPLEPGDLAGIPSRLNAQHVVFVIDEFDRVKGEATRNRLADTIKQVSDRGVNLSFIIVGVSGDLEELVGAYPSIRRSIVGIQLPKMLAAETMQIIEDASEASGFVFDPDITSEIAAICDGSPYLTHLIGLRASQAARARAARVVTQNDLATAILRVADEVHPEILAQHSDYLARIAVSARQHAHEAATEG
jgi:GTPase SAR1 family protein